MNSVYREYQPPPQLQRWVDCFWVREDVACERKPHRVLPDGCIDILFELGGDAAGTSSVVGMMSRPLLVARPGATQLFAVRFRPGAAAAFFREPLFGLTDQSVELGDLWRGSNEIRDRIGEAHGEERRIELLEQGLQRRLARDPAALRRDRWAIRTILRDPNCSIEELCRQLAITRQGLAKAFRENVGVSPKTLARIVRMQTALRQMDATQRHQVEWCDLAQQNGYSDQSHLIREFRELTGLSPAALLEERRGAVSS